MTIPILTGFLLLLVLLAPQWSSSLLTDRVVLLASLVELLPVIERDWSSARVELHKLRCSRVQKHTTLLQEQAVPEDGLSCSLWGTLEV